MKAYLEKLKCCDLWFPEITLSVMLTYLNNPQKLCSQGTSITWGLLGDLGIYPVRVFCVAHTHRTNNKVFV